MDFVTGTSGSHRKIVSARYCSEISGYATRWQLEPAQRLEVPAHPGRRLARRLIAVRGEALCLREVLLEQRLFGVHVVVRVAHLPGLVVVVHVGKPKRRLDRAGTVVPQAGDGVESVVGQEAPAESRDEQHRVDDVVGDLL